MVYWTSVASLFSLLPKKRGGALPELMPFAPAHPTIYSASSQCGRSRELKYPIQRESIMNALSLILLADCFGIWINIIQQFTKVFSSVLGAVLKGRVHSQLNNLDVMFLMRLMGATLFADIFLLTPSSLYPTPL
jgi:hypothetical protein